MDSVRLRRRRSSGIRVLVAVRHIREIGSKMIQAIALMFCRIATSFSSQLYGQISAIADRAAA